MVAGMGIALALAVAALSPVWAQDEGSELSVREADGKKVARILFVYKKDKALKSQELRNAMRIQEGGRFSRRFFNTDLAVVLDLYRGKGYRNVEVTRKTIVVDRRGRLHLTIELDSGEKWTVGEVRIEGGAPFDSTSLRHQVRLRSGDDLDYGQVLEGERALQIFLNQQGYPHAQVRNEYVDHLERHVADVIYHVEPGRKMYCGEIAIVDEDQLHTRRKVIERYLTFKKGDLYNPQELARSRNLLARTDLFRSVFFSTPEVSGSDTLQPIHIRLQERKFLSVGASGFLDIAGKEIQPRIAGSIQHNNWLGRGAQLGLNASWGQPFQGVTAFLTERNLLGSGADLILSLGLSEEWSSTQVLGNPDDPQQYELLVTHDSVLEGLLLFGGEEVVREYIRTVVYDYTSIERLWEISGALTKSWSEIYRSRFSVTWTRARNWPDPQRDIRYTPSDLYGGEVRSDTTDGSDLFADEDFFSDEGFWGEGESTSSSSGESGEYLDYSDGFIPVDDIWKEILTDRSRSVNFSAEFQRDSRDDRISPSRGTFLRLNGLYAIKLGSRSTYVLDGEAEARRYQRLSDHFVLALAAQGAQTASLRRGRPLPQIYWKRYGGEGSVRGVERNGIQAAGGGRTGINLRAELRFQAGALGLVGFWDRANVWRHTEEITLADLVELANMIDGYGVGLRYVVGFPFRFDLAFNDGSSSTQRMRFYFSIGQAF